MITSAPLTDPQALRKFIEQKAKGAGFVRAGVTGAGPAPRYDLFERWLGAQRHAGMGYLRASSRLREDTRNLLPEARTVIVLAYPYSAGGNRAGDGTKIARYALQPDYHHTLYEKCRQLVGAIRQFLQADFASRICVDSAPLLERGLGAAAGIGWIGKNGMLLNRGIGSYFLLCEIVTDLDVPEDQPVTQQCGSCMACQRACPTEAIVADGVVDAGRCLSYWTIEQRQEIPADVASRMDGWIFGCDICQEVCPYNHPLSTLLPPKQPEPLGSWLTMKTGHWRRHWRPTPLFRTGMSGMRRNAAAAAQGAARADLRPELEEAVSAAHPVIARQARRTLASLFEP